MQSTSLTESILLGIIALLAVFWMSPGIKAALEKSKNAKADWPAVLWPLGLVVLFVLALIAMVKG